MCSVLSREMLYFVRSSDGELRCLPAYTRRSWDSGRLVRRARSERRVLTVVDSGSVSEKADGCQYSNAFTSDTVELTVTSDILHEDLHRLAGCRGGGTR